MNFSSKILAAIGTLALAWFLFRYLFGFGIIIGALLIGGIIGYIIGKNF
jgi:hypothetical protein